MGPKRKEAPVADEEDKMPAGDSQKKRFLEPPAISLRLQLKMIQSLATNSENDHEENETPKSTTNGRAGKVKSRNVAKKSGKLKAQSSKESEEDDLASPDRPVEISTEMNDDDHGLHQQESSRLSKSEKIVESRKLRQSSRNIKHKETGNKPDEVESEKEEELSESSKKILDDNDDGDKITLLEEKRVTRGRNKQATGDFVRRSTRNTDKREFLNVEMEETDEEADLPSPVIKLAVAEAKEVEASEGGEDVRKLPMKKRRGTPRKPTKRIVDEEDEVEMEVMKKEDESKRDEVAALDAQWRRRDDAKEREVEAKLEKEAVKRELVVEARKEPTTPLQLPLSRPLQPQPQNLLAQSKAIACKAPIIDSSSQKIWIEDISAELKKSMVTLTYPDPPYLSAPYLPVALTLTLRTALLP